MRVDTTLRRGHCGEGPHKTWLYAGISVHPPLPHRKVKVTMGEVRTISRKGLSKERNPQRLYARDECTKQFTPRAGTSTF